MIQPDADITDSTMDTPPKTPVSSASDNSPFHPLAGYDRIENPSLRDLLEQTNTSEAMARSQDPRGPKQEP